MIPETRSGHAYPVEEFVQTLTAQLDRAQDTLAVKAKTGRPLTFALKDVSIDLKVFWEVQKDGRLLMRHVAPNEEGASSVHLAFTTVTRAMVEENTISIAQEEDPRSLNELGGPDVLDAEDQRRLELAGVRTVGQFRRMSEGTDPRQVEAFIGVPVNRLRAALERSARPAVLSHEVIAGPNRRKLLRIRGANLMKDGQARVRIAGDPVEVLESSPSQLLVRPLSVHREGQFEVQVGDETATGFFEMPPEEQAAETPDDEPHIKAEVKDKTQTRVDPFATESVWEANP